MSKEQVADQQHYEQSIEDNARQYGYKAANLIHLQAIIREFNESQQAASLGSLYGKIDVKIPEFQALLANIIQAHLDEHASNWRKLFNDFKAIFEAQENQNMLSDIAVQKLEELQQVIIACFRNHQLSDSIIAQFLQQNNINDQQLLMVRSTGIHEDKADMANPGGNESLPCRASPEAISAAIGRVAASYVSPKSLSQRLIAGDQSITELPVMPGLIQTMVGEKLAGNDQDKIKTTTKTVASGVVYSNENTSRLQSAYGHGEYVVNSKGKVDNFYITKDGLVYSEIMPKDFRLKPVDKTTDGKTKISLEREDNEASLKYAPSLDTASAIYLHELSKFFEQRYGKRMDLEFVYNPADPSDSNSRAIINIVQARAIPEGARRGLEPSAVAPEFLAKHKSQMAVIDGLQVITPEVNRAAVISKASQVIMASNIGQALTEYNKLGNNADIKAVLVEQPSPDTSHEAGVFNAGGIAVMQVKSIEQLQSLLDKNADQPLIVDPQHSKIYQLAEKFEAISPQELENKLYNDKILAKGIYASALSSYVTVDKYEFVTPDRALTQEPVAITEDKPLGSLVAEAQKGDAGSQEQLLAIAYKAMSYGQERASVEDGKQDPAKKLRDNMDVLATPKIGGDNSELRQALGYNLRVMADAKKKEIISADLFKQAMISGSELSNLLDRMDKQAPAELTKEQQDKIYLEYFNIAKKFEGLFTGHGDSLATSLARHKYQLLASDLAPGTKGQAREYLVESLKLGNYLISKEQRENWQKFCAAICQDEQSARNLGQLVNKIVSYNVHEQWLNYIFVDNDLQDPQEKLAKFAKDFTDIDLAPISEAGKRIKGLEAQIPEWADPSKFPTMYQELQATLQEINKELKWGKKASNLQKILILEQVNQLTDVLDKSTKSLTRSNLYTETMQDDQGNNLQAARFRDMLTQSYGLMEIWAKNAEFKAVDLKLYYMKHFLDSKKGVTLTKAELAPSANFAVNTATIDVDCIEEPQEAAQPKNLEDGFTLIHQNTIVSLARCTKELNKIIERQYPDLVRKLNEQLDEQIRNDGKEIIPSTAIKLVNGEVWVTKNLPLRGHSCRVEIRHNVRKDLTSLKFSIFGKNEEDRFSYISISNNIDLTIADMSFISPPYFDSKKEIAEFKVAIGDDQQIEPVIKAINQSIGRSNELSVELSTEGKLNRLATEWIEKLSEAPETRQSELNKIEIMPDFTWQEFKEMQQANPKHSKLIVQNYSKFKKLAWADLSTKAFFALYDDDRTKEMAEFLLNKADNIETLAKAGMLFKEIITLYLDSKDTFGFLLSKADEIEELAKNGLSPKAFIKLLTNSETKDIAEFLLNKVHNISNAAKLVGLSVQNVVDLYNNPETRERVGLFLNKRPSLGIKTLADAGLSSKHWIELDSRPETMDTAKFLVSNTSKISELSEFGLLVGDLITLHKDPKTRDTAELIVDKYKQIIPILESGKLTGDELVRCNTEQITDLLSGKLNAETLKGVLTIAKIPQSAIAQPAVLTPNINPAATGQGVHVEKLLERRGSNKSPTPSK